MLFKQENNGGPLQVLSNDSEIQEGSSLASFKVVRKAKGEKLDPKGCAKIRVLSFQSTWIFWKRGGHRIQIQERCCFGEGKFCFRNRKAKKNTGGKE